MSELTDLVTSFASMNRWFFDNRLLDGLAAELVARAQQHQGGGDVTAALARVAGALAAINHKCKPLLQHLDARPGS